MNSCRVFLYKHVKTREPLMKCSLSEAKRKPQRCRKEEVLFLGRGPSQARNADQRCCIIAKPNGAFEVIGMSHFSLQVERWRPKREHDASKV